MSDASKKQWCWNKGSGKRGDRRIWTPYDSETQARLEQEFHKRSQQFNITIKGEVCEFEFLAEHRPPENHLEIMGVQESRTGGRRAFHYCVPDED